MVKPASAQSIPKPSVPRFTIVTVYSPYDVPPTQSIDPYTGQSTTIPSYHVENKTTEIKITNQPFTPFQITISDTNWTINFYYNIRLKGHFTPNWNYYQYYNGSSDGNLVQTPNSEFTIVPIDSYLPTNGQLDIQVQGMIGYEHGYVDVSGVPVTPRIITGESSDWSPIQTINVSENNTSPSPSPTVPELSWLVIVPLLFCLLFVAVIVRHRKTANLNK